MMHATAGHEHRSRPARRHLRAVPDGPEARPADDDTERVKERIVALYEEHYVEVARLAYLLVADRHLAEDLAHDAFAALFERWDRLDDPARAPAWLRTTVTNLAMSTHRRRATARKHAAAEAVQGPTGASASAEHEALGRGTRPDVVAALQQLSPKQRGAVVLKYWLRYTEREIADALGCSIGSARTHLHRGHSALAASLGDLR